MARQRTREQHSLEDALAMMSVAVGELRILEAQVRYSRHTDRRTIATCAARAHKATDLARAHLSKTWTGMEAAFHEQA